MMYRRFSVWRTLSTAILTLCLLFLTACGAPENKETGKEEPLVKHVAFSTTKCVLETGAEWGLECFVMDVRDGKVLYSLDENQFNSDAMITYLQTKRIGIFSLDSQSVIAEWTPELSGWYQAGILTEDGNSALCTVATDNSEVYPSHYSFVEFGREQQEIESIRGTFFGLCRLASGKVVYSCAGLQGNFGVRLIYGESNPRDVLVFTKEEAESLSGYLLACGDRFCYGYGENGNFVIAVATVEDGVLYRESFSTEDYTMDSYCLTPQGVVAGVCKKGSENHCLIKLDPNGNQVLIEKLNYPLYRLKWCGDFLLAVDHGFNLCAITADSDGNITIEKPIIQRGESQVSLFSAGEKGCYLYGYPEKTVYTLTAEPIKG